MQYGAVDHTTDNSDGGPQGAGWGRRVQSGHSGGSMQAGGGRTLVQPLVHPAGAPGVWLGANTCYKGHTWGCPCIHHRILCAMTKVLHATGLQ